MLGYRLFVDVSAQNGAVDKLALEQVHSWLRRKNLDADALAEGQVANLGRDAEGLLLVRDEPDGTRRLRMRTVETKGRAAWTTQLTLEVPGRPTLTPWLMVEVEGPKEADPPNLARNLLDVMPGTQGATTFNAEPQLVTVEGVDELLRSILDNDRRTLLFVAGSDSELDLSSWRTFVGRLLKKTVGLASGYVLDPAATEELSLRLGSDHKVLPWTMRTFRPGVDPSQPLDARRHRVLSTGTIIGEHENQIATMLGRRASEVCLDAPLPGRAKRVDRLFQSETNDLLVGMLGTDTVSETTDSQEATPSGLDMAPESGLIREDALAEPPALSITEPASTALSPTLLDAARKIVGPVEDQEELVLQLLGLAKQAARARESQDQVSRRLKKYEQDAADWDEAKRELRQQVVDAQLEQLVISEDLAVSDRRVRHLRTQLMRVDAAAEAWSEPEAELRPEAYEDLLALLPDLHHVTFTGDESLMLGLDKHDPNAVWPGKIWDIACTLEDYGACVLDGRHDGDVDSYLRDTPVGCRKYSGKHAPDETPLLKNTPRYAKERLFRVPEEVEPSGRVFMGAHFRVGQLGMISPRLHYLNDVRRTGRIYIGYVGPHLLSPLTN